MFREPKVSSTPRPIGSIIDVSGILGHPPSRVTTTNMARHSRGAGRPRFASLFALFEIEGAGKTGCLLHPRSRVRFAQTKVHTSIQGSGSIPAFPAQWLYGLLRALPGERLFCLRRHANSFTQLSASTAAPEPHDFTVRIRRVRLARHRVHRISLHVRDDREAPLICRKTGEVMRLIWVRTKAEYF